MPVVLAPLELATLLQPVEDPRLGLRLRQPVETLDPRDAAVGPDAHRLRQPVIAADFEVGRIVARRDLQRAGAELALDPLVGDHGHASLDPRHHDLASDQMAIAVVLGMHGHRDVGGNRRRTDGRDRDVAVAVGERVVDRRQRVVDVHVHELEIRERRSVVGAPVDDAIGPIDPAAAVQMHEEPHHCADVVVVHRETRPPVVERRAHAPELHEDLAAVLVQPLPHALLEALPAELLPRRAFGDQRFLDDVLSRDARVVVARLEQDVVALHALETDDRVAQRELECVPGVQLACHVRRWMRIDVRRPRRVGIGGVETLALPRRLPALLHTGRVVPRLHPCAHRLSDASGRRRSPASCERSRQRRSDRPRARRR